jgi:hypothetical protein
MTTTQTRFFSKPRTMEEIMNDLFNGDSWAANDFQNKEINAGNLETCLVDNPQGKGTAKIIAIQKTKRTTGTKVFDPLKKITLATVKKFIRDNRDQLYINVKSSFDGMTDCVESLHDGFVKASEDTDTHTKEHTLGIKGAWFVGQSRDYFSPYDNIGKDMTGIEVSNSCGSFVLAIPR